MIRGAWDADQSRGRACPFFSTYFKVRAWELMKRFIDIAIRIVPAFILAALVAIPLVHAGWTEDEFEHHPLFAYPLPHGKDDVIGNLITYQLQKGDTLLDVGRWFGVTAKQISNANGTIDWWAPPAGRQIILPDEHILPETPHVGIVLNNPEMRLYYYFPSPTGPIHHKGKVPPLKSSVTPAKLVTGKKHAHVKESGPSVLYTLPVWLGRFDWKTPI